MEAIGSPPPVAVLGGGITGLSAAWRLKRAGVPVVVFEASDRVGGVIGTTRDGGWLHEWGPNSLLEGSPEISSLLDELGLGSRRLHAAPAARNRYVIRSGRLVPLPASPPALVFTRLFSWRAKAALLAEPFRPRGGGERDETVAEFTVRRLGREFLDYAVDPFVSGVYAGDPARLSMRHAFPRLHALEARQGSILRAARGPRPRLLSFPDGLEELPRALASALGNSVRLRTPALQVRRAGAAWEVRSAGAAALPPQRFRAVICALPADALAALDFGGLPGAERLAAMREIEQPPVASVLTGHPREDVAHPLDGFGVLAPAVENRRILGTLFSSTLFAGRAPGGHVTLTTFVGGVRRPEAAKLDDRELLALVQDELRGLLGVRGAPVFAAVRRWPRAIPQYNTGFGRFQDACAAAEAAGPGLFIGGNCRDGISLPNCLESGRRLADAILAPAVAANSSAPALS